MGASSKKSPNLKSPNKSLAPGTSKSPGSSKSPLISPSGKPTYLLAHMYNKAASMQAEQIHRAQEHKELRKEKATEEGTKSRKEQTEPRRRSHEERKSTEERRSLEEA